MLSSSCTPTPEKELADKNDWEESSSDEKVETLSLETSSLESKSSVLAIPSPPKLYSRALTNFNSPNFLEHLSPNKEKWKNYKETTPASPISDSTLLEPTTKKSHYHFFSPSSSPGSLHFSPTPYVLVGVDTPTRSALSSSNVFVPLLADELMKINYGERVVNVAVDERLEELEGKLRSLFIILHTSPLNQDEDVIRNCLQGFFKFFFGVNLSKRLVIDIIDGQNQESKEEKFTRHPADFEKLLERFEYVIKLALGWRRKPGDSSSINILIENFSKSVAATLKTLMMKDDPTLLLLEEKLLTRLKETTNAICKQITSEKLLAYTVTSELATPPSVNHSATVSPVSPQNIQNVITTITTHSDSIVITTTTTTDSITTTVAANSADLKTISPVPEENPPLISHENRGRCSLL